jgi:hypothetical protein
MSEINGFVFCIDAQSLPVLMEINSYTEFEELKKLPKQQTKFIYYSKSRRGFYRAIR